ERAAGPVEAAHAIEVKRGGGKRPAGEVHDGARGVVDFEGLGGKGGGSRDGEYAGPAGKRSESADGECAGKTCGAPTQGIGTHRGGSQQHVGGGVAAAGLVEGGVGAGTDYFPVSTNKSTGATEVVGRRSRGAQDKDVCDAIDSVGSAGMV